MKTLTIREAREGLSHPEQMFADSEEVLVVLHDEPVACILPVEPRRSARSLRAFLENQPMQTATSEAIQTEERENRTGLCTPL